MSSIAPTKKIIAGGEGIVITWAGLKDGDVGEAVAIAELPARTAQVTGVFGASGLAQVEGSLDRGEYLTLSDPQGNPLSIFSPKIRGIGEAAASIRPSVFGDDTTDLTVSILLKRNAP